MANGADDTRDDGCAYEQTHQQTTRVGGECSCTQDLFLRVVVNPPPPNRILKAAVKRFRDRRGD